MGVLVLWTLPFLVAVVQSQPTGSEDVFRTGTDIPCIIDKNQIRHPLSCDAGSAIPEPSENLRTKVTFHLKTRRGSSQLYVGDQRSLQGSTFNASLPTRFITHGFLAHEQDEYPQLIKNKYLDAEDCNVIGVDWFKLAGTEYIKAKERTETAGRYIAEFINFLLTQGGLTLSKVHLIGHSLGAHVMGIAGKNVHSGKVARITGLDPAGFCYIKSVTRSRLTKQDAEFVDVIHTCGGIIAISDPIGHADFYPNGGTNPQPGCDDTDCMKCSHSRAWDYFAESITSDLFKGTLCDSYNNYLAKKCETNPKKIMGHHCPNRVLGSYYLQTDSQSPYAGIGDKCYKRNDIPCYIDENQDLHPLTCISGLEIPAERSRNWKTKVTFHLYTRRGEGQLYAGNSVGLRSSKFDASKPTRIFTHGYRSNEQARDLQRIKLEFLNYEDCNVIGVDWSTFAQLSYDEARERTKIIGPYIAEFITFLSSAARMPLEKVHLIGHGLGAHVMGIAGKNINSGKVARITGLDPAGACYIYSDTRNRLTKQDAQFVDVIHTCSGRVGMAQQIGHADFYPNGGGCPQPGCGLEICGQCSYRRAIEYFAESIKSSGFKATPCESYTKFLKGECYASPKIPMGYHCPSNMIGTYFLQTKSDSPHAFIV